MEYYYKKIGNYNFKYKNKEEFNWMYSEKFNSDEIYFNVEKDEPVILDCGAHNGLSTIYYKLHYPNAKIIAIEPNPKDFSLLKENIESNSISNVHFVNAALTPAGNTVDFFVDASDENPWSIGDSIVHKLETLSRNVKAKKIEVPAVQLSTYLTDSIDIMNLDVEGAETMVLEEAGNKLRNVRNIAIDYHGTPKINPENKLETILDLLTTNGFTWHLYQGFIIKDIISKIKSGESDIDDDEKQLNQLIRDDNYRVTVKATRNDKE